MLSESADDPLSSVNPRTNPHPFSKGFVDNNKQRDRKPSNLEHGTKSANSFLNLNDKELQRQQEEFRKFELLKKDLAEKGFVCLENENISKPSYSQENNKIPNTKLQNWTSGGQGGRNEASHVFYSCDLENGPTSLNSHINSTTNELWPANSGQKKTKETNNQLDNFFGSKLQFSRDSPSGNKVGNKGTIPKNCKIQNPPQNMNENDFGVDGIEDAQQQVAQFENYDDEVKISNVHKGETESLCGLKVQYRLPGLENSSDDDADVVIEDESSDYQSQIPSLMSINVCQFISSSSESPVKNLPLTPSPPHSPRLNTYDEKLKGIISSILDGHKVLVMIRGLPGSGKTHLATNIVRSTVGGDPSQFIFSADDYFVMLGRGPYQYVRSKLTEAHNYAQKKAFSAMRKGVSPVIVCNTHTQSWEMQPYVVTGVQNGYIVRVLEPNTPWARNVNELVRKNTHGVVKESIRNMIERYEGNLTGEKLVEQFSLRYSAENVPPQMRKFPPLIAGRLEGIEGKNEGEKQKNNKRNKRRKKNVNNEGDKDGCNFLLSESDKNMKHLEDSPKSKNQFNTLDNIVSNALKSENDTLNKSLVDYCIETDSGDEIDSDRVPGPQENGLIDNPEFNLLGEDRQDKNDRDYSSSSSSSSEAVQKDFIILPSPSSFAPKKSPNLHQNLGAIGSERKGSVTATDYENSHQNSDDKEMGGSEKGESVLSQCWDFTLLVNGEEIHSRDPPRPYKADFEFPKPQNEPEGEEEASGVIITEIIEEEWKTENLDEAKPAEEDLQTVIDKIINKMDDLDPESESKEQDPDSKDAEASAEPASSIGSIFNMIKKSFLGLGVDAKPIPEDYRTEESIMKYKHQTNDNSLSENDAFENEKSHREPDKEDLGTTIVGDDLSPKLSQVKEQANDERDLCKVEKISSFETLGNNSEFEILVEDNLSEKLNELEIEAVENNQTKYQCVHSSIESDDALKKDVEEVREENLAESKTEDLVAREIEEKVANLDPNLQNTGPVYDLLTEAVNRIIQERETEDTSETASPERFVEEDDSLGLENLRKEDEAMMRNQIFDILNAEIETEITNFEAVIKSDEELLEKLIREEECASGVDANSKTESFEGTEMSNEHMIRLANSFKDLERVENHENNIATEPEIIDNLNQVTWKESPFPVPLDTIDPLPERIAKLESTEKSDSSTNTSNYDFNVLYVGGTSEYKILGTQSRTINNSPSLSLPSKPPLKLMLDKSSMTTVVDILSGEESLEFKTEQETMKDLDELIEMFPNLPRDDITEIYKNLCSCNFNWTVDMLLDGVPENVTKYSKIEAPKIETDVESQQSTPRRERIDKIKQSSSSESNDGDSKSQSPKKRREKHKVSSDALELKRQIEEKMIMSEASYHPHILRVKRWKNGEPDPEEKLPHTPTLESEDLCRETQSPKSSESTDDFTEDDIEPEEMMELNLGRDFIKVLENEFGNPDFQFPGGLFPVIQIKKSMAQQLHALWIESMEQQLNAQQEQLDKMIEKGERIIRCFATLISTDLMVFQSDCVQLRRRMS